MILGDLVRLPDSESESESEESEEPDVSDPLDSEELLLQQLDFDPESDLAPTLGNFDAFRLLQISYASLYEQTKEGKVAKSTKSESFPNRSGLQWAKISLFVLISQK